MATPSPTVPDAPEVVRVTFSSKVAPITDVTVFCENKAEVTRIVNFSSPSRLGLHELELAGLPSSNSLIGESVRVTGSGHCSVVHVSFSDQPKEETASKHTKEENDAKIAKQEKLDADLQRLSDEQRMLTQEFSRNDQMRQMVNQYANGVVKNVAERAKASSAPDLPETALSSMHDVEDALNWWALKAANLDADAHRLDVEKRRLEGAIKKIKDNPDSPVKDGNTKRGKQPKKTGRVLISIDIHEIGPIEMEVKYMVRGATWSPEYDLRVDTLTDSISCAYFGRVIQNTNEDWEGVALKLSTAEPSILRTPPALANKTVSFKVNDPKPMVRRQMGPYVQGMGTGASATGLSGEMGIMLARSAKSRRRSSESSDEASAPPPLPPANFALAQVQGGMGRVLGAVLFATGQPAFIKSNGQTKKLAVGTFQLSAEVTHYVVPSKEPAAYLQAKATNDSDYTLLASDDVSIFFDNSFVTKTSLTSVSPGESFQTFLGIDPAVKITVAPPRKTSSKRGLFSKSNHVTHTHSTIISNKKKVPVTCVVLEAVPLPTDETIKVTINQPPSANVHNSEAFNDDTLVPAALDMFAGEGGGGDKGGEPSQASPEKNGIAGVMKNPSNHLAWVGHIAPQSEIKIPLEYAIEWSAGKTIEMLG